MDNCDLIRISVLWQFASSDAPRKRVARLGMALSLALAPEHCAAVDAQCSWASIRKDSCCRCSSSPRLERRNSDNLGPNHAGFWRYIR